MSKHLNELVISMKSCFWIITGYGAVLIELYNEMITVVVAYNISNPYYDIEMIHG